MLQNWVKRPENPHNSLYSESAASPCSDWLMLCDESWTLQRLDGKWHYCTFSMNPITQKPIPRWTFWVYSPAGRPLSNSGMGHHLCPRLRIVLTMYRPFLCHGFWLNLHGIPLQINCKIPYLYLYLVLLSYHFQVWGTVFGRGPQSSSPWSIRATSAAGSLKWWVYLWNGIKVRICTRSSFTYVLCACRINMFCF